MKRNKKYIVKQQIIIRKNSIFNISKYCDKAFNWRKRNYPTVFQDFWKEKNFNKSCHSNFIKLYLFQNLLKSFISKLTLIYIVFFVFSNLDWSEGSKFLDVFSLYNQTCPEAYLVTLYFSWQLRKHWFLTQRYFIHDH